MSSQVAQYRLLENAESVLDDTVEILEKIANISKEVQTGGALNNVTNYKIEPVWLDSIAVLAEGATSTSTAPGQAYIIKARIDDLEFVGQLMKEITPENSSPVNVNISDDVIDGCVLAGGKLYKATTLELIPVAVDVTNKKLILSTFAFAPLNEVSILTNMNVYTYNPTTNTIEGDGRGGGFNESSVSISKQISLSKGNDYYYASVGTTGSGNEAVYYVQKVV